MNIDFFNLEKAYQEHQPEVEGAALDVKLKHYEREIERRQSVAKKYAERLNLQVSIPVLKEDRTSVWAQYTLRVQNRSQVQEDLTKAVIPTAVHYPIPMHLQECFNSLGYGKGDFPKSETCADEVMRLPMNPYLVDREIDYITSNLIKLI